MNHWKLTDAYALASVFAEAPLELHRCDQPTGTPATVGFLYPQLGAIESGASRAQRQRQLAELLVHPENGRLARTIVNRLWARLFGRGLVEPLDNMDAEPWHQDLLDFLAADLVDHGYDLKHTLYLLATSRAYQLPGVVDGSASSESFVFRGPLVKRMTAEQFVDTVLALTSTWPEPGKELLKPDGRAQGGQLGAIGIALYRSQHPESDITRVPLKDAKWLWSSAEARQSAPPQTIYLRRTWPLDERPARVVATFTADNSFELFINGREVARSSTWNAPVQEEPTKSLVAGNNIVALKAANGGKDPNPAGVIGEIVAYNAKGEALETLSTDETWRISETESAGWQEPEFDDSAWTAAIALGDSAVEPWKMRAIVEGWVAKAVDAAAQLPPGFRILALASCRSIRCRPHSPPEPRAGRLRARQQPDDAAIARADERRDSDAVSSAGGRALASTGGQRPAAAHRPGLSNRGSAGRQLLPNCRRLPRSPLRPRQSKESKTCSGPSACSPSFNSCRNDVTKRIIIATDGPSATCGRNQN